MKAHRETRDLPEIQAAFNVPHFFWDLTGKYRKNKGDRVKLGNFWVTQKTALEHYD
jgi:hypothetical protein